LVCLSLVGGEMERYFVSEICGRCDLNLRTSLAVPCELSLSTHQAMTSLARRSLLQLSRQSPKLHRSLPITSRRLLSISPFRRQTPLETPAVEEVATSGLNDAPVFLEDDITQVDWSRSFHGLSTEPFSEEAAKILTAPLVLDDIEIKPGPSLSQLSIHPRCRD